MHIYFESVIFVLHIRLIISKTNLNFYPESYTIKSVNPNITLFYPQMTRAEQFANNKPSRNFILLFYLKLIAFCPILSSYVNT